MESGRTSATPAKPRISLRYIRATSLPFFYFSLRCPRSKTAGNYKLTQFSVIDLLLQPGLNVAQLLFADRVRHGIFMPIHRIAQFDQQVS